MSYIAQWTGPSIAHWQGHALAALLLGVLRIRGTDGMRTGGRSTSVDLAPCNEVGVMAAVGCSRFFLQCMHALTLSAAAGLGLFRKGTGHASRQPLRTLCRTATMRRSRIVHAAGRYDQSGNQRRAVRM